LKFQSNKSDKVQSVKNERRAITPKLGKAELGFLCTAFLLNKLYLPTKFLVNTFCGLRVMSRTKCGRTDEHTDKAATIIMLSLRVE